MFNEEKHTLEKEKHMFEEKTYKHMLEKKSYFCKTNILEKKKHV